jgi:hypothetical protein
MLLEKLLSLLCVFMIPKITHSTFCIDIHAHNCFCAFDSPYLLLSAPFLCEFSLSKLSLLHPSFILPFQVLSLVKFLTRALFQPQMNASKLQKHGLSHSFHGAWMLD